MPPDHVPNVTHSVVVDRVVHRLSLAFQPVDDGVFGRRRRRADLVEDRFQPRDVFASLVAVFGQAVAQPVVLGPPGHVIELVDQLCLRVVLLAKLVFEQIVE